MDLYVTGAGCECSRHSSGASSSGASSTDDVVCQDCITNNYNLELFLNLCQPAALPDGYYYCENFDTSSSSNNNNNNTPTTSSNNNTEEEDETASAAAVQSGDDQSLVLALDQATGLRQLSRGGWRRAAEGVIKFRPRKSKQRAGGGVVRRHRNNKGVCAVCHMPSNRIAHHFQALTCHSCERCSSDRMECHYRVCPRCTTFFRGHVLRLRKQPSLIYEHDTQHLQSDFTGDPLLRVCVDGCNRCRGVRYDACIAANMLPGEC